MGPGVRRDDVERDYAQDCATRHPGYGADGTTPLERKYS
jgi:hypothetical protein